MVRSRYELLAFLVSLIGVVFSSNINVDDKCSLPIACSQCLSRNSEQIQRCQLLYFFITYSTGGSTNRNNEEEISRYCNGQCPIILATVDYYCGSQMRLDTILQMCPSYSELPSGSLQINSKGSRCLSGNEKCLQCIGDHNREATRCLQLYLLAKNPKMTSTYGSQYCERNCPLVLYSFTGYCGTPISDSFSYCEQSRGRYCGALISGSSFRYNAAQTTCSSNCSSTGCSSTGCSIAINEFGCCLRQRLGNRCPNIPNDCNLPIEASTRDIQVPDSCSVTRCPSCLSRDSRDLQRCEQTYSYLVAAEGIQATHSVSASQRFCSGKCPILLVTSDRFCNSSQRINALWQICPSYNIIPSASVDIRASFRSQTCSVSRSCEECILSNSPQPTRCLQLSLLARHPNMSNFYIDKFCRGNCPLSLATSLWYCMDESIVGSLFQMCQRNEADLYCESLSNNDEFNSAVQQCQINCSSSACTNAIQQYGCCMDGRFSPQSCARQTRPCTIVTAAAPPPNAMKSPLLFAVLYFIHILINTLN